MDQQNFKENLSRQAQKQHELQLWCKALKISPEQFFTMSDDELKFRVNNLKGCLRLKVTKNQTAYERDKLNNNIKNEPLSVGYARFRGGSNGCESKRNSRQRGALNVWEILNKAAEEAEFDYLDSGKPDYDEDSYDVSSRNVTPNSDSSGWTPYSLYESNSYYNDPCDPRFYDSLSDHEADSFDYCSMQPRNDSFQPNPALSSTQQLGKRGRKQHFRNYTDYDFELSGINSEYKDEISGSNIPNGTAQTYNTRNPNPNTFYCSPGCVPENSIFNVGQSLGRSQNQTFVVQGNDTFNVPQTCRNSGNIDSPSDNSRFNSQQSQEYSENSRGTTFNTEQKRGNTQSSKQTFDVQENSTNNDSKNNQSDNATFNAAHIRDCIQNANQTFDIQGNAAYNISQSRRNNFNVDCEPENAPINTSNNRCSKGGAPNATFNFSKDNANYIAPQNSRDRTNMDCWPQNTNTSQNRSRSQNPRTGSRNSTFQTLDLPVDNISKNRSHSSNVDCQPDNTTYIQNANQMFRTQANASYNVSQIRYNSSNDDCSPDNATLNSLQNRSNSQTANQNFVKIISANVDCSGYVQNRNNRQNANQTLPSRNAPGNVSQSRGPNATFYTEECVTSTSNPNPTYEEPIRGKENVYIPQQNKPREAGSPITRNMQNRNSVSNDSCDDFRPRTSSAVNDFPQDHSSVYRKDSRTDWDNFIPQGVSSPHCPPCTPYTGNISVSGR